MTTEAYIAILLTLIGALACVAAWFVVKWMEGVEETNVAHRSTLDRLVMEVAKAVIYTEQAHSQIHTLREEQSRALIEVKQRIKDHVSFGLRSSTEEKIAGIQFDVQYVKGEVTRTILPALEDQKKSFGRVIVLDERQAETDRKLVVLYDVIKKVVERLPKER